MFSAILCSWWVEKVVVASSLEDGRSNSSAIVEWNALKKSRPKTKYVHTIYPEVVLLGNLAFCCRVSAETARFAGRDPEALDRVERDG